MVDLILHSVFGEIAILLTLAAAIGFAGLMQRQPMIVSFIAVGLPAGPSAGIPGTGDSADSILNCLSSAIGPDACVPASARL